MSVPLFLVQSLGAPRNHHALFVRLDQATGAGDLFQVTGNIQTGMTYEWKKNIAAPETSDPSYISMSQLGWVANDLAEIDTICRSNPAPEKQFEGPKRLDAQRPLRRCQEWTVETVRLLETGGILQQTKDD